MEKKLKLPIGIENFSELRKRNYYYVDKTELIEQVLEDGSQVILFTRPRRFGKSLNMSMLKSFFEKETDPALFEGLYIAQNIELCRQYMGQYPVISISLKGVDSNSYEGAYKLLVQSICDEIERFQFLIESNELTQIDKKRYFELIDRKMEPDTLAAVSYTHLDPVIIYFYHEQTSWMMLFSPVNWSSIENLKKYSGEGMLTSVYVYVVSLSICAILMMVIKERTHEMDL